MNVEQSMQDITPTIQPAPAQYVTPVAEAPIVTQQIIPQSQPIASIDPQCGCGGGGEGIQPDNLGYVYAIGNIYPSFPNKSLEEEYMYAYQEFKAQGPPNALFYQVLSQGQNLYIAERMCWILSIQGVDSYILTPRSNVELYHFIAALEPVFVGERKFDVVVGTRGPLASPERCNGLQLPTAVADLTYYFTFNQFVDAMVSNIPGIPRTIVESMLSQMLDITDNAGETDAHRALNYLTIRSKEIYYMAWQMQNPTPDPSYPPGVYFLQGVDVQRSNVQGNRSIMDVIFQYQARDTVDIIYYYVKVDVTGMFPFMASRHLARYYPAP
ncbi:hypothetical protein LX64_02179 [Chitinophaga skermanii]|uniref:PatG domain-containing protein n=1 Tax=Chitinophaga skermanii TaxID=331697 RepID=A0A327QMD2_9BACT|nr:hypothetical protein [Chitinophaga skermanii]RAJ05025.1 hypothetical protein LX64_02179 [Chitinophaga skermanii]